MITIHPSDFTIIQEGAYAKVLFGKSSPEVFKISFGAITHEEKVERIVTEMYETFELKRLLGKVYDDCYEIYQEHFLFRDVTLGIEKYIVSGKMGKVPKKVLKMMIDAGVSIESATRMLASIQFFTVYGRNIRPEYAISTVDIRDSTKPKADILQMVQDMLLRGAKRIASFDNTVYAQIMNLSVRDLAKGELKYRVGDDVLYCTIGTAFDCLKIRHGDISMLFARDY